MADPDYLRQQTQELLRHSPNAEKLQPHQAPYGDWQTVNNEMDRIREEQRRNWENQNKG